MTTTAAAVILAMTASMVATAYAAFGEEFIVFDSEQTPKQ